MSIDYNKPLNFHGIGFCYFRAVGLRWPRAGEWYISGAIAEGYRAPNDLSTTYLVVEPTHHARSVMSWERGSPVRLTPAGLPLPRKVEVG